MGIWFKLNNTGNCKLWSIVPKHNGNFKSITYIESNLLIFIAMYAWAKLVKAYILELKYLCSQFHALFSSQLFYSEFPIILQFPYIILKIILKIIVKIIRELSNDFIAKHDCSIGVIIIQPNNVLTVLLKYFNPLSITFWEIWMLVSWLFVCKILA